MNCNVCGNELVLDDILSSEDVALSDGKDENQFVIKLLHCPHCGCSTELHYPSENDKRNFSFWEGEYMFH